jgi:hypothetical protein
MGEKKEQFPHLEAFLAMMETDYGLVSWKMPLLLSILWSLFNKIN